jgi:8-amino-7-oxononanoate synthase
MQELKERMNRELGELRKLERYRRLPTVHARTGKFLDIDGRRLLNLSSNDYLGLGDEKGLLAGYLEECRSKGYPMTSSSSRLLTGNHPIYGLLEDELAALYGREAALVFNSGYHANIGILPALSCRHDLVLSDKLNHASIIDGMKIAEAATQRYRHGDYGHLEELLAAAEGRYRQIFIVSESVFSMDGDLADLPRLVALKKRYNAVLLIDEAHGAGVFGDRGLGLCEASGMQGEIDIIIGTFGKSFASTGAYAVMDSLCREYLINTMRPLIFTTALPPAVLGWSLLTLQKQVTMRRERQHLLQLASRLRNELIAAGNEVPGESHIVPVITRTDERAVTLARRLGESGFLCLPVRPPTVPENSSRIRISLRSILQWEDFSGLPGLFLGGSGA